MKTRKNIARLLSFLMVFSLLLGISAAPVYAVGGEGETASFEITEANGQTGTVQYKLDSGEFTVADSTPVDLEGVSSITIKATPVADAQVNQSHSGITGTEHAVSFDYTDLTSESGWTYQIQDNDGNITFTIVFDNHDGTGGGSNPGGGGGEGGEDTYTVYFGEGSWEIGGVTVTADKTDVQYLAYNDIITLENFDPETMEVRVEAEDGFSTTLAVTNNQTSISAHTNDGGVPADIAFSVVEKSSNPGGGENPPLVEGPAIVFSADPNADGTLTVSNGIFTLSNDTSVLGTVQVTLIDALNNETPYNGNDEAIPLNDVSSVRIVMSPAEGLNAALVTPGDTPAGALSGPVDDEQENTCTYIAYPAQFGDSQVLQAFIWFGDEFVGGGSDAPVIWDGPQVEHQSDHGFLSVKSIEIGSKTYTYQGEGKFAYNGVVNELLEWRGYNKTSIAEEGGIVVYGDVFTEENVDVFYINFEFNPDYGYQATHVRMTEDDPIPLSDAGFSAAEAIRTFRFAVYPDAHTHFSVIFTATEDIVKANAASISEGGVELATGELDGGSAVLEVNEANVTNQGDFEEAAEGYVVSEYLDISLYNVFYKGNAEDVWSTPVENLDNPAEITLRLEDGINTDTVKIVHEKGEGDFELLDAEYNPATQEITFSTSSFSNYAIAYEEQAQDRYFIDFTNAPWTVDGVEVDLEGRESVAELMVWITTEDVIPLTNFDPDTMDAVLIVDEDVTLRLNVDENGNTRLADVDGGVEVLPPYGATMTFAVVAKTGGEGENVYYIDLGTGDWTVGDVTVSAPDGMSGVVPILDTETIPTEMLANFDPETMDITLTTGDGFVIYLEIDENGNTTLASTRDGVELPPYGETLTFAVVTKPGNMEIVDKTEENACDTVLEEASDVLFEKLGLSAEEVARIENGEDIQVWIEATDISASVSQTDKDLIDSKKGNTTIGMYLDIDLLKQIGSDSPVNITETNGAVTITLKVPSSLINSNSSVTRTYQMIRVHNGVATVIPCTYNAANQTISCETDQFSTYALAYVDQQNNSGGGNTGGGSTGNPETGDNSNLGLWMILSVLSCCSMIALLVIDKKRKIAK